MSNLIAYRDVDENGNESYTVYYQGKPIASQLLGDELDADYPDIEIIEGLNNS